MLSIEDLRSQELPFVRADQEGLIEEINPRFSEVYGWSADDLLGQSLGLILPSFFRDAHHLGFSRFQMGSGDSEILNHPLKLKTVCKDASELESEHFIVAERHGEIWSFAATLRPLE
ncbi:PAS domain-containing protein [Cyanobium sp. Morenito 9A2]|uniref:PAS domain-containing protein n=1 Tax=Cyanobium sp. Morenito 9A2 TaxID=2823718 RepID=UPI0020CCF255|nr:PAS domain-containing protein [Cyanobium sp. Morenito 9A2]MCP9849418.1 PAS domain-containing protein [Cyanobium sp. Morenito 9A2]